jgi:hypothetical protein
MPAREGFNPARPAVSRPGLLYTGPVNLYSSLGFFIPAREDIFWPNLDVYLLFNILDI